MLQVLNIYHMHVCAAEGLCKSHEAARQLLLYIFYGKFNVMKSGKFTGVQAPVVRAIHIMSTNPRRRLTEKLLNSSFVEFFDLMDKKPALRQLTHDKGEGEAPAQYLAAVETGLRRLGHNIHVMGTGAMLTKEKWNAVQNHRKREVSNVRIAGRHVYVC